MKKYIGIFLLVVGVIGLGASILKISFPSISGLASGPTISSWNKITNPLGSGSTIVQHARVSDSATTLVRATVDYTLRRVEPNYPQYTFPTEEGNVDISTDNGQSWTTLNTAQGTWIWKTVAVSGDGNVVAAIGERYISRTPTVTTPSKLFISKNGAPFIENTAFGSYRPENIVMSYDGSRIAAHRDYGVISKVSTNGGLTWEDQPVSFLGTTNPLGTAVPYTATAKNGLTTAIARNKNIYVTTDGGATPWVAKTSVPASETLGWTGGTRFAFFDNGTKLYAVGKYQVDSSGDLYLIDLSTNSVTNKGPIGGQSQKMAIATSADGLIILVQTSSGGGTLETRVSFDGGISWESQYYTGGESIVGDNIAVSPLGNKVITYDKLTGVTFTGLITGSQTLDIKRPTEGEYAGGEWQPAVFWLNATSCFYRYDYDVNFTAIPCSAAGSNIPAPRFSTSETRTLYVKAITSAGELFDQVSFKYAPVQWTTFMTSNAVGLDYMYQPVVSADGSTIVNVTSAATEVNYPELSFTGKLTFSKDGGRTWTTLGSNKVWAPPAVSADGNTIVAGYAVRELDPSYPYPIYRTSEYRLYVSRNGGPLTELTNFGPQPSISGIWISDDATKVKVMVENTMRFSDNFSNLSGPTWTTQNLSVPGGYLLGPGSMRFSSNLSKGAGSTYTSLATVNYLVSDGGLNWAQRTFNGGANSYFGYFALSPNGSSIYNLGKKSDSHSLHIIDTANGQEINKGPIGGENSKTDIAVSTNNVIAVATQADPGRSPVVERISVDGGTSWFTANVTGHNRAWRWISRDGGKIILIGTDRIHTGITGLGSATPTPDSQAPIISSFSVPPTSNSLTVPITSFVATDNVAVTGYLVSENGTTPSASNPAWNSGLPSNYTFSTTGPKTLYAFVKDAAGNISSQRSASVTITVPDTTAPSITTFGLPTTASALTVSVSLTAQDDIGVTGYLLQESSITPSVTNPNWQSASPASFTFAGEGQRTLYAFVKDAAGNIAARSATTVITLPDVFPPEIYNRSPSNELSVNTNSTTLRVDTNENAVCKYSKNSSDTYASGMKVFVSDINNRFSTSHSEVVYGLGAGANTYYVQCQDQLGNTNQTSSVIIISVAQSQGDTEAPQVIDFSPSGTVTFVNRLSFTTNEKAICRYSTQNTTYANMSAVESTGNVAHLQRVTGLANGSHTYYIKCKDLAGNINENGVPFSFTLNAPLPKLVVTNLPTLTEGKSYNLYRMTTFDWTPYGSPGTFKGYLINTEVNVEKGSLGLSQDTANNIYNVFTGSIVITPAIMQSWIDAGAAQGKSEDTVRANFRVRIEAWKNGQIVAEGETSSFRIQKAVVTQAPQEPVASTSSTDNGWLASIWQAFAGLFGF